MKLEKKVIARFVSDHKLPIQVLEEPIFSYLIDLYDEDFKTKEKYEMLLKTIEKYPSQEDFLSDFYLTRDNIIRALKANTAYERFNGEKNIDFVATKTSKPKFAPVTEVCGIRFTKKSDVYSVPNDGHYFLSIDLKKANFQVLKKYDNNLVFKANSYEEFVSMFTDLEYIKSSKYIREVIFGSINTGRQVLMERYYTGQLLEWLIINNIYKAEDIKVFTNDEIVIKISEHVSPEECDLLRKNIMDTLSLDVSVESFKLHMIGEKDYFVKELSTGEKKFKAIPAAYYAQIYKKYKGLAIDKNDLAFYFEKQLAYFDKSLIF